MSPTFSRIPVLIVIVFGFVFATPSLAQNSPHIAETPHLSPEEEKAKFHLPPGFEAQLVASEPAIQKPMNMAFDARGRLWITDSVEYPFPVKDGEQGRDRVVILSDFGKDGKAQKVEVFADGLNIPIGILPLPSCDECIVFSIPNLWHLKDTTGDGKADQRTILYGTFGRDDTHGLVNGLRLGFDGRVYLNHGFRNTSTVKADDGSQVTMNSGNTFRVAVDGSRVEQYTHGQVNPFGSSFDPWGNLYTADCHSKPITQLLRGAYYTSFGKPHDGLGFGPDMIGHTHHSTALCGLVYYEADHFPEKYHGMLFLGNVTGNRINLDSIRWDGSSPVAIEQPDFMTSEDPWFRPVDIQLGPDGALYVADFYNRIIGHYEVPLTHPGRDRTSGRIWRIVHTGATPPRPIVDRSNLSETRLAEDLADPNLQIRLTATHVLANRGKAGVHGARKAIAQARNPEQIAHAMWVLERLGALNEFPATEEPLVHVHTLRILADRSELADRDRLFVRQALGNEHPLVRRSAAEVLGRHPDREDFRQLVTFARLTPETDSHLRHVARMAVRDVLRALPVCFADVTKPEDRAFLTEIAPALESPESAAFLVEQITSWDDRAPAARIEQSARHVARYGSTAGMERVLEWLNKTNLGASLAGYRGLKQGTEQRGTPLPARAIEQATMTATKAIAGDPGERRQGLELVRELRLASLIDPVIELAQLGTAPLEERAAAFAALVAINPNRASAILGPIIDDGQEPIDVREGAARTLTGINRDTARERAVESLAKAPARLARVIASGLCDTRPGGDVLLSLVEEGKASARLLQERDVVSKLRQRGVPDLDATIQRLTAGLPSPDAALTKLLEARAAAFQQSSSDPKAGAIVYKKHCANCHRIENEGPMIGPQLDGIGTRGLRRLLEDILDPSRNVDKALRSTRIDLADGRVVTGLVLREEGETIVLADAKGEEVRIVKSDILERTTSPLSPMPANFAEVIPEAEFHQLMAFLLEQRQKPNQPSE